jgi:hypothetical protein
VVESEFNAAQGGYYINKTQKYFDNYHNFNKNYLDSRDMLQRAINQKIAEGVDYRSDGYIRPSSVFKDTIDIRNGGVEFKDYSSDRSVLYQNNSLFYNYKMYSDFSGRKFKNNLKYMKNKNERTAKKIPETLNRGSAE